MQRQILNTLAQQILNMQHRKFSLKAVLTFMNSDKSKWTK